MFGINQNFSTSELLAIQLSGQNEYLSILKQAKYLEQLFPSENELTEYYCLSADFGNGVYGLDRAAVYYFGKKAAFLSDKEISALRKIALNSNLKGKTPDNPILSSSFANISFNDNYKYSHYEFGHQGEEKRKHFLAADTNASLSDVLIKAFSDMGDDDKA